MQLTRCEHGHYFDPTKYRTCPHCEVYQADADVGYTVAKASPASEMQPPVASYATNIQQDDAPTVAMAQRNVGVEPMTGWLVCVSGVSRGVSYTIHAERNSLGRSERMDLCIKGDLGISRDHHAIVSYNPRARVFTLIPGEGKSIIYLNGQEVLTPVKLTSYDRIEISETTLVFIALCSEIFSWDDEVNQ